MLVLGGILVGIGIGFLWGYVRGARRSPDVATLTDYDENWAQREAVLALCREPHDAGPPHVISAAVVMKIYGVTP